MTDDTHFDTLSSRVRFAKAVGLAFIRSNKFYDLYQTCDGRSHKFHVNTGTNQFAKWVNNRYYDATHSEVKKHA